MKENNKHEFQINQGRKLLLEKKVLVPPCCPVSKSKDKKKHTLYTLLDTQFTH